MESIGLVKLQDGKVTTFGTEFVWTTFIDSHGTLWLGGDPGVFTLQGDSVVPVPGRRPSSDDRDDPRAGRLDLDGLERPRALQLRERGLCRGFDAGPQSDARHPLALHRLPRRALVRDQLRPRARPTAERSPASARPTASPTPRCERSPRGATGRSGWGCEAGLLRLKDGKVTIRPRRTASRTTRSSRSTSTATISGSARTAAGSTLRRTGRSASVTTKNGLFNDVVYLDRRRPASGSLWMSCNRGIFHAKKADLVAVATGARAHARVRPRLERATGCGRASATAASPGGCERRTGCFGSRRPKGPCGSIPRTCRRTSSSPPCASKRCASTARRSTCARSAKLPAGSRDFEIVYTALSFTAPERVRFKYKLEGFDKEWVDAGARRVAYYTNLAPGAYRFRVIAANDDGVWNETGAKRRASCSRRASTRRSGSRLACALGLVLVGAGSVRLRLLALRKKAAELEAKVEERTLELAKASAKLEGGVPRARGEGRAAPRGSPAGEGVPGANPPEAAERRGSPLPRRVPPRGPRRRRRLRRLRDRRGALPRASSPTRRGTACRRRSGRWSSRPSTTA